ncbi:AlpA family transcriptional regulator [Agromyces sp. S2-1-8]|uniref:helix-turn-helix transcriptional regulator n=1 Tax=Agromyces sp. S2-1-8 TaxID=2897180 RepID=UPI001E65A231|nr:hypothetical protein [Agromyces sp. S2-1-8]MCD5348449.1 hypothetical protein [Agromyces sp. S2-1-8]
MSAATLDAELLLLPREAAKLLGISTSDLEAERAAGTAPASIDLGPRTVRYFRAAVMDGNTMSRHSFELGTDTWTIGYDVHQASYFVQRLDEAHEDMQDLGRDELGALPTLEDAERLLPAGYQLHAETRAALAAQQPPDPAAATAAAQERMAMVREQLHMAMADSAPAAGSRPSPAPAAPLSRPDRAEVAVAPGGYGR